MDILYGETSNFAGKLTFRLAQDLERTSYASMLASSGKVDMYALQKLLTHKSPQMTQRYAHLHDQALKQAANVAEDIITDAMKDDEKGRVIYALPHS